jgi:(E)-4-hydroxy-3-methylbut-2-enyl-diphosphate synthase
VVADLRSTTEFNTLTYRNAGYIVNSLTEEITKTDSSADFILSSTIPEIVPENASIVIPYKLWYDNNETERLFPLFSHLYLHDDILKSEKLNFIQVSSKFNIEYLKRADPSNTLVIFNFDPEKEKYGADTFLNSLDEFSLSLHVVLHPVFHEDNLEELRVKAASLLGKYVTDRKVSGISIHNSGTISESEVTALSFSILQCTETRITRTLYLSCPTCGRTKFNLQESVQKVKEATGHLKGLKIAVMGCVVNGPGEMAGADYGYVGAAAGKVHIYRGTVPVLKNVPEKDAADELLRLIEKDHSASL